MWPFKPKKIEYNVEIKKLNDLKIELESISSSLFFGVSLPVELETFRLKNISRIEIAINALEQAFHSEVYNKKMDRFIEMERYILSLINKLGKNNG